MWNRIRLLLIEWLLGDDGRYTRRGIKPTGEAPPERIRLTNGWVNPPPTKPKPNIKPPPQLPHSKR